MSSAVRIVDVELLAPRAIAGALDRFYVEDLGLGRVFGGYAVGPASLRFAETADDSGPFYHFALLAPGERFAEAKRWLAGAGRLLSDASGETTFNFNSWDAKAAYSLDPAGNIVDRVRSGAWMATYRQIRGGSPSVRANPDRWSDARRQGVTRRPRGRLLNRRSFPQPSMCAYAYGELGFDAAVKAQCKKGARIEYIRDEIGEHLMAARSIFQQIDYLAARFDNQPVPDNCSGGKTQL